MGLGVLAAVLIGASAATAYLAVLMDRIDRVEVASLDDPEAPGTEVRVPSLEELSPGEELPELGPPGPAQNYLLVGTDSVEGIPEDDPVLDFREEESENTLADTIMVLRLDPENEVGYLVSIPRDLWVPIAGTDFELKINSAFNITGDTEDQRADRLVSTVKNALDIPIHHFVHVNWSGFRRLVDIIGGVEVCFERPTRDTHSGLDEYPAGRVELDGVAALAFVRSRQMEVQDDDGTWRSIDAIPDFNRSLRQQAFLSLALDQTVDVRDPRKINDVLTNALDSVQVDQVIGAGEAVDLARRFADFSSDRLFTWSLGDSTFVRDVQREFDGQRLAALELVESDDLQLIRDLFNGIPPFEPVPKRVEVSVAGVGSAEIAGALSDHDFRARQSARGGSGRPETVIRHEVGEEDAATVVAAYLDGPFTYEAHDSEDAGWRIELQLGTDPISVRPRPVGLSDDQRPVVTTTTTTTSTTSTTSDTRRESTTTTTGPAPGGPTAPGLCVAEPEQD